MNTEAQRLVSHSARDIDAAREMFEKEEYEHVVHFCRNAVEKLLKATLIRRAPGTSPKGHNIVPLAALAGLSVPRREFMDLFTELGRHTSLSGDTPIASENPPPPPTREGAQTILRQTNDVYSWLSEVIG